MKKIAIVYWSGTGNTAAMAQHVKKDLRGRTVGLFGSYEWNEGEWMETWQARTEEDGANVIGAVIAYDYPDGQAEEECVQLGKDVVAAIEG